ncbi:PH domain-containing protein [Macrococcus carouselicus]|nr:PH domain-containing protein [Macrococcus carouselicus]
MRPTNEMNRQPEQVKTLKMYHYLMVTGLALTFVLIIHYAVIHWSLYDRLIYAYSLPVLLLLFALIAPRISYYYTAYRLNSVSIETSHGLFWHHRSVIPMDRVQHVAVSSGPLTKHLNLAKVKVYTSGESIALPYVAASEADEIARLITERVKEVAAYV